MNLILRKTHDKKNIDLMKARNAFFDKARIRDRWFILTIIIPPLVASLTYLPYITDMFCFVEVYRDYIVGACTIVFVVIGEYILKRNAEDLYISNALREEYDLEVFGIERNNFAFDERILKDTNGVWKNEIVEAWEKRPDSSKYEVWYQEVFSDNKRNDVLCLQMDNIIYTYHIYREYKKYLKKNLYLGIISIAALLVFSIFYWKNIQIFILIMFSLFGALQSQINDYRKVNELIAANSHIYNYVLNNSESVKKELTNQNTGAAFLRSLQDFAISNREKSLFVPKKIRKKYLENGNPFYIQLDKIKNIYMDDPYFPNKAEDIDILSNCGDSVMTTMDQVHKRLLAMLKDVDKAFREADVHYMLDGGSLIGACRDEKGFVFWDDDVDIALKIEDIERAKQIILEKLGDKYDIQDYLNDEFYSPRLSNFRIREKNEASILEEKDSELYEKYDYRGLFIDVYAYSPIVVNRTIDRFLRRVLIQGFSFEPFKALLNRIAEKRKTDIKKYKYNPILLKGLYTRIHREEVNWKNDKDKKDIHLAKFLKLKKQYLKRIELYLKMANNKEYYAYVPNYIDNLYTPGPYITGKALEYSVECEFEDMWVPIPVGFNEVLTAYYNNWRKTPFLSLDELKKEGKYEFSRKKFDSTALKHIKYINKF